MINIETLNPFPRFCYTIGMIPSSYKESLTYEEQLMWFCNFLENTVIPTVNNNGLAVEELQNLFVQLKSYVDTYFDNLDVQEEVNNKLDEMAESGQLADIIADYIQLKGILAYNTVADMKVATNLVNGSFVQTYGFYEKGDLGNAKYKIRLLTNEDNIDNITLISLNDNTLVAELIKDFSMNIKQFGAKGDGIQDDTLFIQTAINNVNHLLIPATNSYYLVTDNLLLKSNQIISGEGETSKLLMPNNLEKTIFEIKNKNNIIIENIKLCNESGQTGEYPDLSKNKIIYTENVQNLTIQNCFFENAYSRGIQIFKTKHFRYINNNFKNATYEMLLLLQEVEDVIVDNCIFDTITSSYINTYLFATGKIDDEIYEFATKNVTVKNSKFLNNPIWEGIDTHACLGFYCENNYIENCKVGIMAENGSTSPITTLEENHGNIVIKNNIIKGLGTDMGIQTGCSTAKTFLCKNVVIENNFLKDCGRSDSFGAIAIRGIKNGQVIGNTINDSHSASAITVTLCLEINIKNNKILDVNNQYMIHFVAGCWFINIIDNSLKNYKYSINNNYGVRGAYLSIAQLENNDINANTFYSIKGTVTNGSLGNDFNSQIGKKGNFVKNEYGFIKYYCTDSVIRPAKSGSLTSVSLSGSANTNIVTGSNAMYYLTEGEEITIPNAGASNTNLTTIITEFINKDTFKIKDNIETSFSAKNPSFTAGTWTAV